ncbi:acetyl-CoA acetyltransferase [Desertimonas flava]|uniref:acetyl-CoA acetyltransferase n=1 Tax=Desertimonas flava TaxID=2064846 RepID=UPI000E34C208|nr:acetyl-CoA acetyltransferase [Desertimonas flava]
MTIDPRTPVIIGVGQFLQRTASLSEAREPVELMADAVEAAAADAGLAGVPNAVDSIRVVNLLSWKYGNPAAILADRLAVTAREFGYTSAGGNTPQSLVNLTSLDIAAGNLDVALLVGGEAWRTRMRSRKEGVTLDWAKSADEPVLIGGDLDMTHPAEAERGLYLPVQMYPMFETAIRAAAGRSPADHLVYISELWSRFSEVAAGNPYAWLPEKRTAEDLRTVTEKNRMIGLPYPKSMNSNNDVDMAAALLICSAAWADEHGVPRDRWVFPHSGTDCHEHQYVSNRWAFAETPAVRRGGELALELAGIGIDDVSVVDLYSCFPSAVQLGAASLGLDITSQLTRTGGLNFGGGPWNNYVMHAIATVVGDLRERPGERGLVWANGGYLTKHAFGVYSTEPPAGGFRHAKPQAEIDALPRRELATGEDAAGPATVEAYTVMHDRDGLPELGIAACLLADGRRAWGLSKDAELTVAMTDGEWVGRDVALDAEGALHA